MNLAYGASKAANVAFGQSIAKALAKAVYVLASADSEWASGAVLEFNGASYLRM